MFYKQVVDPVPTFWMTTEANQLQLHDPFLRAKSKSSPYLPD